MKKISLLLLTAGLILSLANCQKQSDEDFLIDFGKTVCYKMADCALESMAKMSEAQKKQMKAYMPSHELCDKQIKKEFTKEKNKFMLSSEEKALALQCVEDVKKTACSDLQKNIPSCKKFNKVASKKRKS